MREGIWLAWLGSVVSCGSNQLCSGEMDPMMPWAAPSTVCEQSKRTGAGVWVDNGHLGSIASVSWALVSSTGNNTCCSAHGHHIMFQLGLEHFPWNTVSVAEGCVLDLYSWHILSNGTCMLPTSNPSSLPPPQPPYSSGILGILLFRYFL